MEKGLVFTVEAGKYVYRKTKSIKNNIYFVLHGELEYRHPVNEERFGDRVTIGFSVGEEILFEKPALKSRIECVAAVTNSCLIQLDATEFTNMAKRASDGGGSTAFREDKEILWDLCRQFYFMKSLWRNDEGMIDELPEMMEPWLKKQEARAQMLLPPTTGIRS